MLKDILQSLCLEDPLEVDESFINNICNQIKEYYKISDVGRHSYAEVSSYIYKMEPGYYEYLIKNLQTIYEKVKADKNIDLQKTVFKLIDHIKLESNREVEIKEKYLNEIAKSMSGVVQKTLTLSMKAIEDKEDELKLLMSSQEDQIKVEFQKQTEQIENQKKEMQEEFEKQTKEIDKINSNLISVLGIFGAIIVAFFGGLSFLGGVLQNMHSVSSYRLVFISVVILEGLFNIIFMLLHSISKLTTKNLWSSCKECTLCTINDFKTSDKRKTNTINKLNVRFRCLYNKYPLVVVYNIVGISFIAIVFALFIIDKYNFITAIIEFFKIGPKFKDEVARSIIPVVALIMLVVIILLIALICILIIAFTKAKAFLKKTFAYFKRNFAFLKKNRSYDDINM